MIDRRDGESESSFQKRIIAGKLINKDYADEDYGDLSELLYGERYGSDYTRKLFTGMKLFLEAEERDRELGFTVEDNSDPDILDKIELATIALKKERVRTQENRTAYQKMIREQAKHETTKDIIKKTMENLSLPPFNFNYVKKEANDNEMLISLSDLHIGATVNNHWNQYDTDIAADRLKAYLAKIIQVNTKEKCKTAMVYANGDIVSGIIHPNLVISAKENLIQQIMIASELLSEFLNELSYEFEEVKFCSVPGNHSRLSTKEDSPLSERADDLVEFYLEARLQNVTNIHFYEGDKIDSTICLLNIKGKNIAVVHGDMDSEAKAESLQKFCGVKLYAILSGHMHHLRVSDVRGIKLLQSGSMMGCDDYTVSKRIYGTPSMLLTIFGDDGIECFYGVEFENNVLIDSEVDLE